MRLPRDNRGHRQRELHRQSISNARRCGRLHCFFTGLFFLSMALVSLVHGFGRISLGGDGWAWIGGATLVGTCLLTILPERIWGHHAGGEGDTGPSDG